MGKTFWAGVGSYSNVAVNFVVFVALARLLTPEAFGIVAIASVFTDVALIAARGGLPDAVIQRDEVDEEYLSTAFWMSIVFGLLIYVITISIAWPISSLIKQPELLYIVAVLSLSFPISSLSNIHEGRIYRTLGFKRLAIRTLLVNLTSGAVALWMAYHGYGAWSLVVQRLISVTVGAVVTWISFRWIPALTFKSAYARELLKFGSSVFGTNMFVMLNMRIHELIAAVFLPVAYVGFVRLGWRCIDIISQLTITPFATVALPTYSRLQADPKARETAYFGSIRYSSLMALPCFLGFSAMAPVIVPLIFGKQWHEAIPTIQILLLVAPALVCNSLFWPMLISAGAGTAAANFALAQLLVGAALTFTFSRYGIEAFAVSNVARVYLMWPISLYILDRRNYARWSSTLKAVVPPLLAAASAAAVALVASALTKKGGALLGLALPVGSAAIVYCVLTARMIGDWRPLFRKIAGKVGR